MTTYIDINILQNVAPGCLNRDDVGAPKTAMFGGTRRARISSQCLKRAQRKAFAQMGLLEEEELGTRTNRIVSHIEKETAIINTTIFTIEKEIALVEEYKTALIAEAVTGKIDVRGYVETLHAMSLRNAMSQAHAMYEEEENDEEEMSIAAEDEGNYETEETA